jgi:hypothetical protein
MSAAEINPTSVAPHRTGRSSSHTPGDVFYPESDGLPMAENETQLYLMMAIIAHLRSRLGGPNAHVGGDMFWYPVEGRPDVVRAPDVFVVFGRPQLPKRRTWKQWEEDGHPLDVVMEIVSPSARWPDLARLLAFYDTHGVREYLAIDPQVERIDVFRRVDGHLTLIDEADTSELTGLRLEFTDDGVAVYDVELGRVLEPHELRSLADAERARADSETARADAETARADTEARRADTEARRADTEAHRAAALAARLRELGVDPDSVS